MLWHPTTVGSVLIHLYCLCPSRRLPLHGLLEGWELEENQTWGHLIPSAWTTMECLFFPLPLPVRRCAWGRSK